MPYVSIIIPCYNAELCIEQCLYSVLEQDYGDFEVIVIDDGSSDNTPGLLESLALTDSRIVVAHKGNGGVSSARNLGLGLAKGEWITFVDSDDRLLQGGLAKMIELAKEDIDIVFAGYIKTEEGVNFKQPPIRRKEQTESILLARELFLPNDFKYMGYPWAKLFRASIIRKNSLSFDESVYYNEDRLFTLEYLAHSRTGAYTTEPVYNYIVRSDSAMSSVCGPSFWKFETDLDAFIKMIPIADTFGSPELSGIVRRQTFVSYRTNRRLNRIYGKNDRQTNRRLKMKTVDVLSVEQFRFLTFRKYVNGIKEYANIILVKLKLRNNY